MAEQTYTRRINIYVDTGQAVAAQNVLLANQDKLNAKLETQKTKYKEAYEKYLAEPSKKAAEEVKRLGNAIDATKESIKRNTEQLDVQNKKINGSLSPSIRDLTGTIQKLRREMQGMSEEDPLHALKASELRAAEASLVSLKGKINHVATGWKDMLKSAGGVALGVLFAGGVQAIAQSIISAFTGLVKFRNEFEASVKNLSAITGATGADLDFLENAAIKLASSGSRSATEYVEAMKFIASAKPELLKAKEDLVEVTKAAALLSRASGLDLPEASKRLTDALNQYGAPARDAAKYVDALAAAAKYGAAEVPDITDALLQFGAIAKQTNISIYESGAAIELLAEKGIKGAEAGTKLRNIFLTLSAVKSLPAEAIKQLEKYGVNTGILTDKTQSLEARLKELSKVAGDADAMMQIFDKQNVVAATNLLQNIPRYAQLAEQVKEVGVASAQAGTNTATLSSAWGKLLNSIKTLSLGVGLDWLKGLVSGAADAFNWIGKLTGVVKSNTIALQDERQELLLNEARITALNVGNENRTKLIQELQDKYPAFLANLDAEKVSNEEISEAINQVNNSLLTKIALAQVQERMEDAAKERSETEIELADAKLKMEKELAYLLNSRSTNANKYNKQQLEGMSLEMQAAQVLSGNIRLQEVSSASLVDLQKHTTAYNAALAEKNTAVDEYNKILTDQMKVEAELKKQLGIQDDATGAPAGGGAPAGPTDEDQKKRDKFLEDKKKFLEELAKLENESYLASLSANERDIVKVQQKYAKLKEEAKKFGIDVKRIETDMYDELYQLTEAAAEKDNDTAYRLKLKGLEEVFAQAKLLAKQEYAAGLIDHEEYNNRIKLLDVALLQAKAKLADEEKEQSKTAADDALKFAQAAKDAELNLQIEAGNAKLKQAKSTEDEITRITQQANTKRLQDTQEMIHFTTSAFQGFGQIMTNIENGQLAHEKKVNREKAEDFKRKLDNKKMTQKAYDKAIEQLHKQEEEKAHALALKQWKRDRALRLTMAVINTAASIMNALASIPYPANLGFAAAAAITGGIQIGVIASEKAPEYERGIEQWRLGIGGDRHSAASGGNPIVEPNSGRILGTVEEGEAFIPRKNVAPNRGLIRALVNANGRSITLDAGRVTENMQYANGGIFGNKLNTGSTPARPNESIGITDLIVVEMQKENARQIKDLAQHMKNIQVKFSKDAYDRFNDDLKLTFKKRI